SSDAPASTSQARNVTACRGVAIGSFVSVFLEPIAPRGRARQMHSGIPGGTHTVRHAEQHRLDLADLACPIYLEDLMSGPGPRARVPDHYRASVFECVGAKSGIVVQEDSGGQQAALLS